MEKELKIIQVKVKDIIPYKNNAKKHDQVQINNVAQSIKQLGFRQPIVLDKDNVIIIGHCRWLASKKLKLDTVPCHYAEDLTEEQVIKLRNLDNKLNESEWDYDLLKDQVINIDFQGFDIDWGIPDIESEPQEVTEDIPPEVDEVNEPICKLGDIWQLGEHRLMCGDSTKEEDVAKLMNGNKADLVVTDPPYNVAYEGKTEDALTIKNDNMDNAEFFCFLSDAFYNLKNNLKDGGAFYVWFNTREHINFESSLKANDLIVRQEIVWVKNSLILGRQDYQQKHEPCLYGWKLGAGHYFTDDRTQTTVYEDKGIDLKKLKKEEMLNLLENIFSDKTISTIIHEDRPSKSELHPTMKPIKLLSHLIKNSSKKENTVLDLFGGSGSTLITCEQLNRKCYMMELPV